MKFFISHSSKDKLFGETLVSFLCDIGANKSNIVFTSKPGYGIPKTTNIFQWLKEKLQEKPYVIYLLSNNYYNSVPCLNEMGAAWIIENNHAVIFTPNFNIDDKRFHSGVIDPREMAISLDNKHDITDFTQTIKRLIKSDVNDILINEAVERLLTEVDKIKEQLAVIEKDKEITEEYYNTYTKDQPDNNFVNDIIENKLADYELLALKYMSDMGTNTLGHRWKADEEIIKIKKWQTDNKIGNSLSENYEPLISKFKMRNYIKVNEVTSHGNPREFILTENISKLLLNFPLVIEEKLVEVINRKRIEYQKENDFQF